MSDSENTHQFIFSWEQGKQKKNIKPSPKFKSEAEALDFHPNTDLPSYKFLKYKNCDFLTLKCLNKSGDEVFSKSWRPKHYSIANDWAWVQDKEKWVDNRDRAEVTA